MGTCVGKWKVAAVGVLLVVNAGSACVSGDLPLLSTGGGSSSSASAGGQGGAAGTSSSSSTSSGQERCVLGEAMLGSCLLGEEER
jgi:hypothetical protein